jgi:hypothetical protein
VTTSPINLSDVSELPNTTYSDCVNGVIDGATGLFRAQSHGNDSRPVPVSPSQLVNGRVNIMLLSFPKIPPSKPSAIPVYVSWSSAGSSTRLNLAMNMAEWPLCGGQFSTSVTGLGRQRQFAVKCPADVGIRQISTRLGSFPIATYPQKRDIKVKCASRQTTLRNMGHARATYAETFATDWPRRSISHCARRRIPLAPT